LTDRRILFFLTEFVWPSSVVPRQRTADGLTDRRILFFLTEFVWPSSVVPSQRTADSGQRTGLTDRRILFFLTEFVWPSSVCLLDTTYIQIELGTIHPIHYKSNRPTTNRSDSQSNRIKNDIVLFDYESLLYSGAFWSIDIDGG
jgi:hypothetical protein